MEIKTVGELRKFLEGWPDDTPIFATWEGVYRLLDPEYELKDTAYGPALVFDVEYTWPDPPYSRSTPETP